MKKFLRISFYVSGCIILAFGITLNTKAGLGISPLISMPYSISEITGLNFSALTFLTYSVFIAIQFLIDKESRNVKLFFQLPFSFVFSLLLEVFGRCIAAAPDILWVKLLVLTAALVFTGIGISMTVNMDYIPNPADGLARSVGKALRKDMGFGKNTIDCISVVITCLCGLIFAGKIIGVGIGTLLAVIFVGRVVKVFNILCGNKMIRAAGLPEIVYLNKEE